ncbi:MAG: amidophosphoribosyltransferase [Schleiferiaceae bacterium]|nr:amidophosphoribosyltransferase [Schleiferiaceae bacterium]
MSDAIKHECGIALVRLLKPLEHYQKKYGTALYGINKMYLLMEKQHNRGQDGAGLANIKFDMQPGQRYISRYRSVDPKPIQDIFVKVQNRIQDGLVDQPEKLHDAAWLKANLPFVGELYLGHLRYGTYGGNSIENCHPFLRQNNWITRNLILAGNFNLTNVDQLFDELVALGQHPKEKADTVTVMEKIGHFLDEENDNLYYQLKEEGVSKQAATEHIANNLDIENILVRASKSWDGGYAMAGLFGHGDAFVLRDPSGIRPVFYYCDDEIAVVTSERPVIQTAFNVPFDAIKELEPGNAIIIKKKGDIRISEIKKPLENAACSFERIYFSRGNDAQIYQERIELGRRIVPAILKEVDYDLDNTVLSFIPNTAEVSFYGMMKGVEDHIKKEQAKEILQAGNTLTPERLQEILNKRPRAEKIAWKDVKLRTFITQDNSRDDLVSHVYDTTYGVVGQNDNLIMIDDSIVRGTTLRQSILKILDRLGPKKIVIVSSAPQIRYPDCYGIDMARMGDFIAFRAAMDLLKTTNQEHIIRDVYRKSKEQENLPDGEVKNYVKEIYEPFTPQEISDRIAELLKPIGVRAKLKVIFQTIEDLHEACPANTGDWYFTGNFPTPGGNRVVNRAFINFMEGRNQRAY